MRYFSACVFLLLTSCARDSDTIKIKGSDTEVNLAVQLAETFHSDNPEVFVSISGGGSGLGIASLLNGTADMANSSRSINSEEIVLFHKKTITIDSFIFAQDAIAFVVSDELPIDSISTKTLALVLSGTYKNWSSVTSKKMPVNIYGRQSNSGTHDFVKKKLKIAFSPHAKEMNGNAQILEAIKQDNSGIGYVGAGYVIHGGSKGLKVLTVYSGEDIAVSPLNSKMIAAGKYFFQRPLFQYYKSNSYDKVKPFLDFEKGQIGQKIIKEAGYYPVN
ncbi:PstS family phosphate ABC transporter substrate-binding protein [Dyadobacter arcticus]|uniref:Phosphate transport system substrate-binding protein n=1 Tax=Dyadobacter arcticus TaxID=1078754 RepID=A0ABX0UKS7_9BACT|nr:PstS family phosphate ABC transporter substrate-binding protein [Dyadobacter arcticus]NIJ52679.1 phosphate transport system substrate-binding protein [Dyadobacter arcticus]